MMTATRAYTKLQYITIYMEEHDINVYLMQETWLKGDIDHWVINRVTFCMHAPETQQTNSRGMWQTCHCSN
jgi:hypothetical protein